LSGQVIGFSFFSYLIYPYSFITHYSKSKPLGPGTNRTPGKDSYLRGVFLFVDDTTPAETKAVALNNARRAALEEAVEITMRGSSVIYNNMVINDMLMAASKGLIIKETILENKWKAGNSSQMGWYVKIEAHVKPLKQTGKGTLRVKRVIVQRPDRIEKMNIPVF
jgi:hypothetical protein